MLHYPVTNIKIQRYQNRSKFKYIYSQNNLPNTVKNGSYIVKIDKCRSIVMYWIALYSNYNSVTYFDSFGVEQIPEETNRFIDNKNITVIFRTPTYDLIMCRYFCIGFPDSVFNVKTLTGFTNIFLPHNFRKNDEVILRYFFNII